MTELACSMSELLAGFADEDAIASALQTANLSMLEIRGLSLDSRLVQEGDLYLAVSGASTHGLRFAQDAIARGAVAVAYNPTAVQQTPELASLITTASIPFVAVDDLGKQCASIATRFYQAPDEALKLIAVTGTDGKTSVCQFIATALSASGTTCGYIGTLGWGLGDDLQETALTTPDVIALRRMLARLKSMGAVAVAMEASSHGIESGRLSDLSINVAVLTNLGRDHLDYHQTIEAYREAKAALFDFPSLDAIVVNADDELGLELLRRTADSDVKRMAFSSSSNNVDAKSKDVNTVRAVEINPISTGLEFSLIDGSKSSTVNSSLMGRFNVDNLLASYTSLKALGVAANEAVHALAAVQPVAGRMERFTEVGKPTVIVDYAHTPQALAVALSAARAHCDGKLWVVFGCGGDRDKGKRAPMARAARAADHVIVTDDNPRNEKSADIISDIVKGFDETPSGSHELTIISDRAMAIEHAVRSAAANDLILVAGKGHEDYQIVGTQRLDFSDRKQVENLLKEAS